MKYFTNVKKQYLMTFFYALIFAYVIERLFWQERGMNVQMVVYAEVIYGVTVTLCEIPSGVLADMFGRKKLLVADSFFGAGELLIILFAQEFWHFAVAVIVAGIGGALSSGAGNAMTYDSLLAAGRENEFEKHRGRLNAISFAGYVIAALSGSVLASVFSFEFNYILSIISVGIVFVISLTLREPPRSQAEKGTTIIQYVREGLTVFKFKPLVLRYCLTGAVLGACITYLHEFWQILMESVGVPVIFFGIISAVGLTLMVPGSLLAYRLRKKLGYKRLFNAILVFSVLGYTAICFIRSPLVLIPMFVIYLVSGLTEPLVDGFLHKNTESSIRATTESFSSLILRVTSILVGLPFGYISMRYSIFAGFLLPGIVCLVYLILFQKKGRS